MRRKIEDLPIEELEKYKIEEQNKIEVARRELDIITRRIAVINSTMNKINEAIDKKTLHKSGTRNLLEHFPETETRRKLKEKYLKSLGLECGSGYWIETNQSVIRISLLRNDNDKTQKVYKGILEILPYIKPLKTGRKLIDIFEHTLSLYDSYYLEIDEHQNYSVTTGRMIRSKSNVSIKERTIFDSKDLLETLKYIQLFHYYEEN